MGTKKKIDNQLLNFPVFQEALNEPSSLSAALNLDLKSVYYKDETVAPPYAEHLVQQESEYHVPEIKKVLPQNERICHRVTSQLEGTATDEIWGNSRQRCRS